MVLIEPEESDDLQKTFFGAMESMVKLNDFSEENEKILSILADLSDLVTDGCVNDFSSTYTFFEKELKKNKISKKSLTVFLLSKYLETIMDNTSRPIVKVMTEFDFLEISKDL